MLLRTATVALLLGLTATAAQAQDARLRAHEDLRSAEPERVRRAAERFGRSAPLLRDVDLEALSQARAREEARVAAAPELRDAFRRVAAEHPLPAVRARAGREAAALDHDARTAELRRLAHALQAEGAGGVRIWTAVARRAVEHAEARADLDPAQRFDEVLADLGRVFNGRRSLELLGQYERRLGKLPGSDPLVPRLVEALEARTAEVAWAGYDLDAEVTDFRPELHDGSRGQVYHSNFFFLLGYAAGREDPRLPHWISLKHETTDDSLGHCEADWVASAVAIETGRRVRRLRDEGGDLRALPDVIGAAFGKDLPAPTEHTALVAEVDAEARARIRSPRGEGVAGKLASKVQRGIVSLFERLQGKGE